MSMTESQALKKNKSDKGWGSPDNPGQQADTTEECFSPLTYIALHLLINPFK